MRYQFATGNPGSAELAFSQLLWKGLAKSIEKQVAGDNGNAYGKALVALANYSGHAGAIPAGAGECSDSADYPSGLKVILEGMVGATFPIGKCLADVGMKAVHATRNMLSNQLATRLYQEWSSYADANDGWHDLSTRGDLGLLIQYQAEASNPDTSPYQITPQQRDQAYTDLQSMFARWKSSEMGANTLKDRLTTLKARFINLPSRTRANIAAKLPAGEQSEANVFWRYVELMSHARSRLLPYVPTYYDATDKDIFAEGAVDALLTSGQSGWNSYIAGKLQEWEPKLFASNPMTCATTTTPASATTGYLPGWCDIPISLTGTQLTADNWESGWRYNGEVWQATATGKTVTISGTITCAGTAWSYYDYDYSISIKASSGSNAKTLFSDSGKLAGQKPSRRPSTLMMKATGSAAVESRFQQVSREAIRNPRRAIQTVPSVFRSTATHDPEHPPLNMKPVIPGCGLFHVKRVCWHVTGCARPVPA